MKNQAVVFLLAVSALLFWGCPFESRYELGSAMLESHDAKVLGKWQNMTDSVNRVLLVQKYDEPEYKAWVQVAVLSKPDQMASDALDEIYDCRFAKVGNMNYIIMYYDDEELTDHEEHYYYFYKLTDNDNLVLKEVNPDYTVENMPASDEELRLFFLNNQSKPEFFVNEKKYKRIKG